MKINRNMLAVGTNQHLLRNEKKLSLSMERLSSGYKINRAGDNPSGLAISHKMKAQIDGVNQAKSNTTDAQSVLRIADGALNEASSILQRIRELCVQAGNDTNSLDERTAIQDEIDKLTEEIDRISSDTEYNTKALLDGSSDILVISKQTERMYITDKVLPGNYSMTITQPAQKAEYPAFTQPTAEGVMSINGIDMKVTAGMSEDDFYALLRDTAELAGCIATKDTTGAATEYTLVSSEYGSGAEVGIKVAEKYKDLADELGLTDELKDDEGNILAYSSKTAGTDAEVTLTTEKILVPAQPGDPTQNPPVPDTPAVTEKQFNKTATVHTEGLRVIITDLGGFKMDFSIKEDENDEAAGAAYDLAFKVTDVGAMTIQMGANQYQDMDLRIPAVSAKTLYLDKVDVTVSGGTDRALVTMDQAVDKLNDVRARIGAFTNRLEYAERSLDATSEDMTSAYSNILDTDMAAEMVEYTQQNVLEQASISVLAQANDLPQQVLSLLQ